MHCLAAGASVDSTDGAVLPHADSPRLVACASCPPPAPPPPPPPSESESQAAKEGRSPGRVEREMNARVAAAAEAAAEAAAIRVRSEELVARRGSRRRSASTSLAKRGHCRLSARPRSSS